jgi:hypothetical protein
MKSPKKERDEDLFAIFETLGQYGIPITAGEVSVNDATQSGINLITLNLNSNISANYTTLLTENY